MGADTKDDAPNLLDCVPSRLVGATVGDDGKVTVLRPRFIKGPLARWLQPRLKSKHFHVQLDEIGSFVWQRIDGQATVADIVEAMEDHFGDKVAPAIDRLDMFLRELRRGKMLEITPPNQLRS